MGMSSSQARLLTLTGRMHDIERKAQKVQADKLRLANDSNRVYEDYLEALDTTRLTAKTVNPDGSIGDTLLTGNKILSYGQLGEQYMLKNDDGKTIVSQALHSDYLGTHSLTEFLNAQGLVSTGSHQEQLQPPVEVNPLYTDAENRYNTDHGNWASEDSAYQTAYANYTTQLASYEANHAQWVLDNDAYNTYMSEQTVYNTQHAQWVTDKANYDNYLSQLATYNTEHEAWQNASNNYDDYVAAHAQWVTDHADWVTRNNAYNAYLAQKAVHDQWVLDKAAYDQYLIDLANYQDWLARDPQPLREDKTQIWWERLETGVGRENLDKDFVKAGGNCYVWATGGDVGCYGHVLAHLVDYDGSNISQTTYTTTLGGTTKFSSYGGACDNNNIICADGITRNSNEVFKEVSDVVATGQKVNVLGLTCDITAASSDYEKLLSKFKTDGSTKTLREWIIDLYYLTQKKSTVDGYPGNAAFGATIEDIQHSLANSLYQFNETLYNQTVTNWQNEGYTEPTPVSDPGAEPPLTVAPHPGDEPIEPTYVAAPSTEPTPPTVVPDPGPEPTAPGVVANPGPEPTPPTAPTPPGPEPQWEDYVGGIEQYIYHPPVTINHTTFTDKDKAQWYANLWCKLEKLDETPKVQSKDVVLASGDILTLYSITDIPKSTTTYGVNEQLSTPENENYVVVTDELLDNNVWLTNVVNEGLVLIQKYGATDSKFYDTSVAADPSLAEVQDTTNIKKAEAKYEADMKKIDKKERWYDSLLAKFDTERDAIKSEMETLKTVSKENVERTFKLFG